MYSIYSQLSVLVSHFSESTTSSEDSKDERAPLITKRKTSSSESSDVGKAVEHSQVTDAVVSGLGAVAGAVAGAVGGAVGAVAGALGAVASGAAASVKGKSFTL